MYKLADVEYQVQGPGELRCKDRVRYCCHIISIYLLYALHIACIYHVYQINFNCIYRKFQLDIHCICYEYCMYFVYILLIYPYETRKYCWQVKDAEHHLRHKLFPANAWMIFFHCTLRPIGTVAGSFNRSDEDIPIDLIFFSPFEELHLRTAGIMESKGIYRVYELSPVSTLYVGRVEDLLGRVPLIPCFLDGNATSPIPHKYRSRQKDAFECGCADGAGPTSRRGSHVHEINTWLWNFGRPQLRVAWAASLWAKVRSSDGSPGLRLPSANGQLSGLAT
jgi:hypothetical protein